MINMNAMLLCDFYKAVHAEMLPKGITKSVSYFTPRMSRVDMWPNVVMFGLQGFIKEFLIDYFNKNFFNMDENECIAQYTRIMDNSLGKGTYNVEKIRKLHHLGYLPIQIIALKEGTIVPMHVPMFGITNTLSDFAWLPQALESVISAEMWHPMLAATVGHTYREIVNMYYHLTCDDDIPRAKALGAFDFRGEECTESAIKAGAGWCMSFLNTATVPTIPYLEKVYNCDCTKEPVAFGSPSTEHSVMCSNYAVDGDEKTLLVRLLRDIYPHTSFSAVLDSYDYWNVINNILPEIKEDILAHDGCMLMRGDSGDCIEVVTETVFKLWDIFGGTVNSKGYKVLDPHVKAIYGDSITIQRCKEIYKILMNNGFACSNVALGVGSFSFQCVEENAIVKGINPETEEEVKIITNILKPFTRDTFSSCIKATYCEIYGMPTPIFKNPKDGGFKKSQKGCCIVTADESGNLSFTDGHDWNTVVAAEADGTNLLQTVFLDGKIIKETSVNEIRNILNGGAF